MNDDEIKPGIYLDMPEAVYHGIRALSNSGMKHLAVSDLYYWHKTLNPLRELPKETAATRFGKAAHCLGLEPKRFEERFAPTLAQADFPGVLVTASDMGAWLAERKLPKSGKRKQELIDRILATGEDVLIWDILEEEYAKRNDGKVFLDGEELRLIRGGAAVIAADPYAKAILTGGMPEVSFVVHDPDTGVLLKARMDYVKPEATVDLKTFSNSRAKPIEKAVADAVYYEGYYKQCRVYSHIREVARRQLASGEIKTHGEVSEAWTKGFIESDRPGFGFVFIESEEPFHLEIIELREREAVGADRNVYWSAAQAWMEQSIYHYGECLEKYGDAEWRMPKPPRVLVDTDLPQLMFAT